MKLMVIDGNSIINRAFYGVRMLNAPDGTPTNAVYGFLNMLFKIQKEQSPDGLCVTFDLKAPTFRHERYDGYKAQRKPMPEELAVQLPILKEILDAMNIRRYELSGYEADDLIGTISGKCEAAGWECVAVTGDKDSFQLITDKTSVLHIKSRMGQTETKLYDRETFVGEYGFEPINMIDLKALMGDASDNIPGVPGVGEKTAMTLLSKFGSVKNVYENIDDGSIAPSVRKKLVSGREMAELSYELATICCDAPIEFSPSENTIHPYDNERLYSIFSRLGLARLIEKLELKPDNAEAPQDSVKAEAAETIEIMSAEDWSNALEILKGTEFAGIATDEDINTAVLCCGKKAFVISDKTENKESVLKTVFSDEIKKAGHDIKDVMRRLIDKGLGTEGWVFDSALAAYLMDPTRSSYELSRLSLEYCGYGIEDDAEEGEQLSLLTEEKDRTAELKKQAEACFLLKSALWEKLEQMELSSLFSNIELPLCPVLANMEHDGILVDRDALSSFGDILTEHIGELQKEIYELAGEEFNISSPKQLGVILFEKLMLPAPKKTKTGWSTNIDVLERLRDKHPIINRVIEYRQFTKFKSTYADGLLKVIGNDGRIHTNFQMTVTATGRLSSTEPNLQNIPVRTALGSEFRKMFVASPGNVLVDADYSQIELRLLAHISGDKTMAEAFTNGADIHAVTASQVFGVPLDSMTPELRSRAKAVNFGIVYGISAFSLAQDIGVPVAEAKRYMDSYFEKYSGVKHYMYEVVRKAKEEGSVKTEYGRIRPMEELRSSNRNVRAFGERVAMNMPIQGTAADIMKIAMINVFNRLKKEKMSARLLLQIHDELIVECPKEEAKKTALILKNEMENAAHLTVPLVAETAFGESWYEAK